MGDGERQVPVTETDGDASPSRAETDGDTLFDEWRSRETLSFTNGNRRHYYALRILPAVNTNCQRPTESSPSHIDQIGFWVSSYLCKTPNDAIFLVLPDLIEMNAVVRAAILKQQSFYSHLKSAFFHSTPVLERKRRTSWDSKSNVNKKRFRRMREKQELLRNVNAFAANMFTSWHDEFDDDVPSSRKKPSWFNKDYSKEPKGKWNGKHGSPSWGKRHFDFCEVDEDFDVDYVFRTAFGGSRGFSFSFTHEEDEPRWQHHSSRSSNNTKRSWRSKHRIDYEEEDGYTSTDSESSDSESEPNQASHRQALGLSLSGPLNLKDVKHAYRICALKWHPDRHQGSTKEAAEAKFKLCSVAYQSLCEKLAYYSLKDLTEMNAAAKAAILRPQSYFSLLQTAFFHSTPVLERKRRSSSSSSVEKEFLIFMEEIKNFWQKSNSNKKKRSKKFLKEHEEKIRRAVEELKREREEAANKAKGNQNNGKQGSKGTRKGQYGYDDTRQFDFMFRSLFGVPRGFNYSTYEEEERLWWYHPSWDSDYSRNSWKSKYRFYDKEEEEVEDEDEEEEKKKEDGNGSSKSSGLASDPIQASHRQTLGLSPWGPLKLEDVKHAYRTCALKWHPDRHDVSTKAEAEAKFKLCTVAYQFLIEKLQSSKIPGIEEIPVIRRAYNAQGRTDLGLVIRVNHLTEIDQDPQALLLHCLFHLHIYKPSHESLHSLLRHFELSSENPLFQPNPNVFHTTRARPSSKFSDFRLCSGDVRKIKFCQWCGGPTKHEIPDGEEKLRAICTHCDKIAYQNPKMVVGCLIEHEEKVLLCKRNIQPSHGLWTLPAGYLEVGESAAEGAMRETLEEAGATVEVISPFAQLDIPLIGQTYVIFLARLKNLHFAPGPESLECRLFALDEIPFDSLAFSSIYVTLNLYLEDVKNGKLKFHYGTINKRPGSSPSDIRAFTLDYHLQH
ncbi:unnamed protein product [Thlaspi arvense]|uniref:Uncharacterized protein n=1 Tax=Thlaspi arvense TaxID=13288 RepID=A0AAU9S8A6_THLAR|nr:unnamed protein product [Thlaspi arvense]